MRIDPSASGVTSARKISGFFFRRFIVFGFLQFSPAGARGPWVRGWCAQIARQLLAVLTLQPIGQRATARTAARLQDFRKPLPALPSENTLKRVRFFDNPLIEIGEDFPPHGKIDKPAQRKRRQCEQEKINRGEPKTRRSGRD